MEKKTLTVADEKRKENMTPWSPFWCVSGFFLINQLTVFTEWKGSSLGWRWPDPLQPTFVKTTLAQQRHRKIHFNRKPSKNCSAQTKTDTTSCFDRVPWRDRCQRRSPGLKGAAWGAAWGWRQPNTFYLIQGTAWLGVCSFGDDWPEIFVYKQARLIQK